MLVLERRHRCHTATFNTPRSRLKWWTQLTIKYNNNIFTITSPQRKSQKKAHNAVKLRAAEAATGSTVYITNIDFSPQSRVQKWPQQQIVDNKAVLYLTTGRAESFSRNRTQFNFPSLTDALHLHKVGKPFFLTSSERRNTLKM